MNLAVEYDNACGAKDDMRKSYEECNDIPQETRALVDTFLKEDTDKDYEMRGSSSQTREICDVYLTEKELHQLQLDEEALRETLEQEARDEKEREEKIRQRQADNEEFMLEFGVKYDSEYESD
ncbi:hypothetical protein Tco_1325877 [Tanacetum coccineum]